MNVIDVRNLCKKYKTFALEGVTFSVPKGYISGFIGPNGAGKTTTIKSVLNIVNADSGEITVMGEANNIKLNERVGVVMDAPMYVDDWTVSDVEKAVSPFYKDWDKKKFAEYIREFGLDKKKKVKDLSRGMKVKLQIAAALSHNAELLILDEPTSGLDPVARDEICDLLREFVSDENKTVFFSTHITTDLEKTADYITFIFGGKIVYSGTKDGLLEKYSRITGAVGDVDAEFKKTVIGYREHSTGFEGMIDLRDIRKLPKTVLAESVTLDEIIIFINKEAKNHE